MKGQAYLATYRKLRDEAVWKLLAADNGPAVLAVLHANLYEKERTLPASIFLERLERDLEDFRAAGHVMEKTPQYYVAQWLQSGYLVRRYPAGASEEEYELSVAAVEAVRFVSALVKPHSAATESRLSVVVSALNNLARDTDADRERRVERLLTERSRIDAEILRIRSGDVRVLPEASAIERARDIITLADQLTADFRRVRDDFERLNRDLRQQILDEGESRGAVLNSVFAGFDLIAESEAGRTFSAFWALLTDSEQTTALDEALSEVLEREFFYSLDSQERRFLRQLPNTLLEQGGAVHEVFQHLARSLKNFVSSREYLEQRRLNEVLKQAQRAALDIKDRVSVFQPLEFSLDLTSARIRSLSQWSLYDPQTQQGPGTITDGEGISLDLQAIGELVAKSEIDFRALKKQIRDLLDDTEHASIGDVLLRFPATQGLGTVVGLLALGSRFGRIAEGDESVSWTGEDHVARRARIPKVYFLKEHAHELA
jgi:hypothetical protein